MGTSNYKILCFEYILHKLLERHAKMCPNLDAKKILASYTRLKALKLLFFISAVKATATDKGLLRIFGNFYAMEHGPVESDIYDAMTHGKTNIYNFSSRESELIRPVEQTDFCTIKNEDKLLINDSISLLLQENPNILNAGPFKLVGITHKWLSWKLAIRMATALHKRCEKMKVENIMKDVKYFS